MTEPRTPVDPSPEAERALDDPSWIARLLAGDPVAVDRVRVWVRVALGRFRASLIRDLEDLEQQTLLELLESLAGGRFRGESRFETYVHSFARHRAIDRLRAQGRRETIDLETLRLESREPSPFDETIRREAADVARSVLAELSPECREVWSLIARGLSYREMSQQLGVSDGALRVRAFRCRQRAVELRDEAIRGRAVTKPRSERLTS